MQPKLLRVLQEKEFERVGGAESISTNARIIAATNVSLRDMMKHGRFREDLFYRLNIVNIRIPPLRERREDIPLLVYSLIEKMNLQMGKEVEGISDEAMEYLVRRNWPGNVRELQNSIERAMNASWEEIIQKEYFTEGEGPLHAQPVKLASTSFRTGESYPYSFPVENTSLQKRKESLERKAILAALAAAGNNKSKAARLLNISRTLLYQKLEKYNIGK